MKELSDYLYKQLSPASIRALLNLYVESDEVKLAKAKGGTDPCYLLAHALTSGAKPSIPKFDGNAGG